MDPEEKTLEMIDLALLCKSQGWWPHVVCEVGVNEPDKCSVRDFIDSNRCRAVLVEPLFWCAENLRARFPSANVIEAACVDSAASFVQLYDRGEGAWIAEVPPGGAPDEHPKHSHMQRATFDPRFLREVPAVRFADIDPGNIDLLCVDVEGAEWFVISQMKSRPRLIRAETHFSHSGWQNPYRFKIESRLAALGYKKLAEDVSDSFWIAGNFPNQ